MQTRAQRNLGNTASRGDNKSDSSINKNHWKLIAALLAGIISAIVIAEVIHRRRMRRRAAVAPVPRPTEPSRSYLQDPPDKPTREDYEHIWRLNQKRR